MASTPQEFADNIKSYAAAITTWNADEPVIVAANKKHAEFTGYSISECVGKSPRMFQGPDTDIEIRHNIKSALLHNDFFDGTVTNHKKDGKSYSFRLSIFGIVIAGERYYLAIKQ